MNDLCADIGYKSINHYGEQLCGDHVDIVEPGDESNTALWLIVMITALGAALFTANKPRRKQRDF